MNVKHVLSALVFAVACALALSAHGQQSPQPATVEIVYDGEAWEAGRPLAICVQTGLRTSGATGAYRVEYRFAHRSSEGATRSTLPELQFVWADTSFMLVDAEGNLIATTTGQVRGKDKEQVQVRAVNGDGLLPGDSGFNRVCGELTGTKLVFVPRETTK